MFNFSFFTKFGPLANKDKKTIDNNRDEIFQKNCRYALFDHKRNEEDLEEMKVEPVDEKIRRYCTNKIGYDM
jgi:hypothetical protein